MTALTPTIDATARQFLTDLWGAAADGNLPGVGVVAKPIKWTDKETGEPKSGFKHFYPTTIDEAVAHVERLHAQGVDVYFAMALFDNVDVASNTGNRVKNKAIGARCFWLDIDCGEKKAAEGEGYLRQRDAGAALKILLKETGLPLPTYIVSSGYGLHVYWVFDRFIPAEEWREWGRRLKSLLEQRGFLADPSRTGDIASVLRVPGTHNFKDRENAQPVKILGAGTKTDPDAFSAALTSSLSDAGLAPAVGLADGLRNNLLHDAPSPETPENVAKVRSMLAAIDPDVERGEWMRVVWAVMATGWACAEDLVCEWSMRGEKWNEDDFGGVVRSFKPDGGVGFGTLVHFAKAHGWVPGEINLIRPGNVPEQASAVGARADRGDVMNGEIFARLSRGRLLFIAETKQWLEFDPESGWLQAAEGEEDRAAKATLTQLAQHAAVQWAEKPDDPKAKTLLAHVAKSHALPRLRAMTELAKSETGMTARLSDFDTDPWLLGVRNGVLNLKTRDLMPMSPSVLVSKRANVAFDPEATCPQWEKFLREVLPDDETRAFVQRLCGYFLSGVVAEHIFPFLSGGGGNGKGVFVETSAYVLGEYAVKIETAMLMEHKRSPQAASPDKMQLRGARLAYCSETSEGQRLDAERVKEMTGGDTVTARDLYSKPVSFQPSHKLLMMGNYKPEVSDMSAGMWRRVVLIPFAVDIPKGQQDTRLTERLKAEGAGILNWMLRGLYEWRKNGLQVPEYVSRATDAYRNENDIIGDWLSNDCVAGPDCEVSKDELYSAYTSWCVSNGHKPTAKNRLTIKLGNRGFRQDKGHRKIVGLRLKKPGEGLSAYALTRGLDAPP